MLHMEGEKKLHMAREMGENLSLKIAFWDLKIWLAGSNTYMQNTGVSRDKNSANFLDFPPNLGIFRSF